MRGKIMLFIFLLLSVKRYVGEEKLNAEPEQDRNSDIACYAAEEKPFRKAQYIAVFGWVAFCHIGGCIPPKEKKQIKR